MKIARVEVTLLGGPGEEARPHWVSHYKVPAANELLVVLTTEDGLTGFGLASSNGPVDKAAALFPDGLTEILTGIADATPESVYQALFSLTHQRRAFEQGWARGDLILASAAVDIAMWDLLGKAAGLPLFRLFGGLRAAVPCYVTCAYYRDGKDEAELRDEMQRLKAQGHRAFKAKIGGVPLNQDMARLRVVREVIGESAELMIDVNCGWDLETAYEGVKRLPEVEPSWLEEPVRWYDDHRLLKKLAARTDIPLSGGESEQTAHGCRALLEENAISILQFDCTRMGGFTMGRKLAALAEFHHVEVAPHHDCFLHAHIVAASPAGLICESFTDPERDPLQARLFLDPPRIEDGVLYLKEQPGLGLELNPDTVAEFGRKIC